MFYKVTVQGIKLVIEKVNHLRSNWPR